MKARLAPTSRPLQQKLPHRDFSERRHKHQQSRECRDDAGKVSSRDAYETGPYLLVRTAFLHPHGGPSA
jgi:hypothetical protein